MQPSPPLRCEMAVRAAALAQARTAELLGVPAPASHQSTSCSGRCKKQTGPALFAPGNSRAASAIPPAAWLTHRVPARPPPASVLHLPGLPLGAGLVCAKRRRGFPSEHQRIFSKGQRFLRAHLPLAPSLFVFFFQSAGCLGQKEVVTAAHNACIQELLQEIDVVRARFLPSYYKCTKTSRIE